MKSATVRMLSGAFHCQYLFLRFVISSLLAILSGSCRQSTKVLLPGVKPPDSTISHARVSVEELACIAASIEDGHLVLNFQITCLGLSGMRSRTHPRLWS